jgi:hypothetical protein
MTQLPPHAPPPQGHLSYVTPGPAPAVSAFSIVSIVVGIMSIPLDIIFMAGVLTALVGLILGIIGVRRSAPGAGRVVSVLGIIFSSIAMLVGISCGIFLFNA